MTQPWATLVAIGAKQFETRSWRPVYRGPLAIQAAKGMPKWADELTLQKPFYSVLKEAGFNGIDRRLPRGAIVALVDLIECRPTGALSNPFLEWIQGLSDQERAFGDFSPGRWAWRLDNVRTLPQPIPCRGYQFLWDLEAEVAQQLVEVTV